MKVILLKVFFCDPNIKFHFSPAEHLTVSAEFEKEP